MKRTGGLSAFFGRNAKDKVPPRARSPSAERRTTPGDASGTPPIDAQDILRELPTASSVARPQASQRAQQATTTPAISSRSDVRISQSHQLQRDLARLELAATPRQTPRSDQPPEQPPEQPPDIDRAEELAQEAEQRRRRGLRGWECKSRPIDYLALPEKITHPASAYYINQELKGRPKWLWDSHTRTTVLAEDHMFEEGYVAISYTWGRWRERGVWRRIPGTPWGVPAMDPRQTECKFDIMQMMDILCRMPNVRYFWVDVLCIRQDPDPRSPEEVAEKAEEIAKQGAIFKEAKGVLVYLWSLDSGSQLAAAADELGKVMRWYWQIVVSQDFQAASKRNGREQLMDQYAQRLRSDPWFSSLWTLQEMVLAPASVWIARDGSHCQVNGQVLTTHLVGDKFEDFTVREHLHDALQSNTLDPARNYVQSNIPESENRSRRIMLRWLRWAFQETSVTTCVGGSRGGVLLATLQRKYTGRREMAVLAALMMGNDGYDDESHPLVGGLAVPLWNELIRAEGGRLFDCSHSGILGPLTDMLPTTAHFMGQFGGIRVDCSGWQLTEKGELKIPILAGICLPFSKGNQTEYQFPGKTVTGGDPEDTVKRYLLGKGIQARHVLFLDIGYQTPYRPQYALEDGTGGGWKYAAVRGVILVTLSENVRADSCRWYKAGMFFTREFQSSRLTHEITVAASSSKQ
ncbi:hypothetical protein CCMA1212_009360 [Trichoderma ghanense]|uniref:Heterokaryon incompatibility domain-containing protein n=1 Tax=Trichoderma ghanense TaxID=65468 RepID=A0ABY2GS82_9HYPO